MSVKDRKPTTILDQKRNSITNLMPSFIVITVFEERNVVDYVKRAK